MADRALILDEQSGELVEVFAKDLSDGDKKRAYFCCGRPKDNPAGPICMTPLDLVTVKNGTNYFASLSDASHHQFYCEFDMSEEARKIGFIDVLGNNTTLDELIETLNRPKNEENADGYPRNNPEEKGDNEDFSEDCDLDLRPIERVPDIPRALRTFLHLLCNKTPDELYAGKEIKDFFLNREGIREFRQHGLMNGNIKIAVLKKVSLSRIKKNYSLDFAGKGNIKKLVLVDAFYYDQREQEQIFILSTEAYEKIYAAPFDSMVCVFASWRVHPRYSNVFISIEKVEDGCIEIMEEKYFK